MWLVSDLGLVVGPLILACLVEVALDHRDGLRWVLRQRLGGESEKMGQIPTSEGAVECGQCGREQGGMSKGDELGGCGRCDGGRERALARARWRYVNMDRSGDVG